jgi:hypothetical protein
MIPGALLQKSLPRMNAAVLETETRAGDQLLEHARSQNLAWAGKLSNACGEMNCYSAHVIR